MDRKARLNLLGVYEDIWSKGNFPKEWCDSNPHTEKPNNRRKLPTYISDELPVQGPRKDRK
jgi:hypothetical protein